MAGLNFDITANNSDFLKKTEEIKKGIREAARIIEEKELTCERLKTVIDEVLGNPQELAEIEKTQKAWRLRIPPK